MSYNLSPLFNGVSQFDADGNLLVGGKLYWYLAGTTTPVTVYKDNAGASSQTQPIVLNARGAATYPIWLLSGQSYKAVLTDAYDVILQTIDNIVGINDTGTTPAVATQEWIAFPGTPSYVDANTFSVAGDYRSVFEVDRRVRLTVSSYLYGTISAVSYSTGITSVDVVLDSGALSISLTAVDVGILTVTHPSIPGQIVSGTGSFSGNLNVDGAAVFGLSLDVLGSCSLASGPGANIDVPGAATFGNTVDVTGNATVGGTLDVTGAISTDAGITAHSTVSVDTSAGSSDANFVLNAPSGSHTTYHNFKHDSVLRWLLGSDQGSSFALKRYNSSGVYVDSPISVDSFGYVSINGVSSNLNQNLVAVSGYKKFPGGLILQWGTATVSGGAGAAAVNFSATFSTACFCVIPAVYLTQQTFTYVNSITTSGCNIVGWDKQNNHQTNDGDQFFYIALGY